MLASVRSLSSRFVLLGVCFLFECGLGPAVPRLPAMDGLLVMILCAALAGMIIGSLGTIATFWCCGFFARNSRTVSSTRLNPELENALIQAGYGQPSASGEASSSVEMRRTQTVSVIDSVVHSFRLHVGDAGTLHVACRHSL